MKKLVLYCSIDGNTDAVAHAIADKIDADTARLVRVKKVKGFGFFNNLKLRMEVIGKKKPDIFPFKWDPRDSFPNIRECGRSKALSVSGL